MMTGSQNGLAVGSSAERIDEAIVDRDGAELLVERAHGFAGLEERERIRAVVDEFERRFDDGLAQLPTADGRVGADAAQREDRDVAGVVPTVRGSAWAWAITRPPSRTINDRGY